MYSSKQVVSSTYLEHNAPIRLLHHIRNYGVGFIGNSGNYDILYSKPTRVTVNIKYGIQYISITIKIIVVKV